jgi:hypothetical protein
MTAITDRMFDGPMVFNREMRFTNLSAPPPAIRCVDA